MGKAIPQQHPAVVLRSHYAQVRNLLAVSMIALVGLSGAVVIIANDQDELSSTTAAKPAESANPVGSPRYFEGVQESTRGIVSSQAPGTRYDGGPEEGTSGIVASPPAPSTRYDGGPEEGTSGTFASPALSTESDAGSQESPTAPGFSTD
jgi:hypothetical protein